MPSIIPDPGPPPAVEPITEEITFDNTYSIIPAGTQIYVTDVFSIFFLLSGDAPITNNGTLWLDSHGVFAWLGQNPDLVNTGLIYLHGNGIAELSPLGDYLSNSGSIFAVSDTSGARVIDSDVLPVFVANSGLLAAQCLGINNTPDDEFLIDYAITIDSNGILQLINDVPGRILAEAPDQAIAVSAPSGEVHNLGLIEAQATSPDGTSVGVYFWDSRAGSTVTNSGTIRADIAIYGAGGTTFAADQVENQASGLIDGLVALGLGDDSFVNHGTVIGDVDMGRGADVYSGGGSVSGVVDMGFDNDSYSGSGNADRAYGGREDDMLGGNGGNDQLFGGFGNDDLHGDGGNDALIGEWGNDTITTAGGDYVEGGEDNDRVILGDYSFEKIDGGSGFDTLVLQAGARTLNLASALATGRLADIEQVELSGDKTLVIQASDVTALTGGETSLRLVTSSTDHVNLVGAWTHGSDQVIDGMTWGAWTQGAVSVLVQGSGIVTPNSANAGGGLDAIAAGGPAPHPVVADYTDTATYVDYFTIFSGDFTVDSREIFFSDTVAFYSEMSEWTFTNDGEIYSINDAFDYANGLEFHGRTAVVNNGLIHVEALRPYNPGDFHFPSLGVFLGQIPDSITLDNHGEISVYSATYSAIGVSGSGELHNDGLISAISENSRAIGVTSTYASHLIDEHQTFFNTGTIYAEGGGLGFQSYFNGDSMLPVAYAAAGVVASGTLTNDGDIIAVLGANAATDLAAVGVYLWKNYNNTTPNGVTNNGTIEGTIAIKFDNAPGDLSQIGHFVTNNGTIFGDIQFQDANDTYSGASGVMQGTVFGYGGDDTFTGGKLADSFDGGAGNDTMNGGAGNDTASYSDALAGVTVNLGLAGPQDTVGAGIDTLVSMENVIGSAFADTLTSSLAVNSLSGNGGSDTFRGTAAALTGDTITDFAVGDKIVISDANLAGFASDLSGNTLTFTGGSLSLPGDFNGYHVVAKAAAGGGVELTLQQNPTEGDDVITGTPGDDVINALGGNDIVSGLGGNDTIDGGTGIDTIDGGAGNDTLNGGAGFGDTVTYATAAAGVTVNLSVTSAQDTVGAGTDTLSNFENLTGSSFNDTLSGDSLPNLIDGGAGADTMSGGVGDDTYVVDNVGDVIANDTSGPDVDTVLSSVSFSLNDMIAHNSELENLTLTGAGNISGIGTNHGNVMIGNSGDNVLSGLSGNDQISGGTGNDTLEGGDGDDVLDGGSGVDTASYASATSAVTVTLAPGFHFTGDSTGTDSLTSIENLYGSAFNDSLTGDNGANTLNGGAGDDTLTGNGGVDILVGASGNDTLSGGDGDDFLSGAQGNDVLDGGAGSDTAILGPNPVSISLALAGAQATPDGAVTLISIENLIGSPFGDILTGDAGANILDGSSGNDILDGGAGADTLIGGLGDDRFYIDNAGDQIVEAAGQGDDIAFVLGTYTLAQGASVETLYALNQNGTEPLVLTGNEFGQSLYGNLGDNYLNGGQGNDYLVGLAGNDNLLGGTGADTMQGGTGNDVYYADDAGDRIFENAGEGSDIVVATASWTLNDGAEVETMSADPNAGNINLTGNEFGQSLYGNAGNNVLTGGGGADYMVGGAGNDVYYVDPSDFIGENVGGGDDTIVVATSYTLREGNEIEALVALDASSTAPVDFTGNEFGQSLYGSEGVNHLDGGAGNDFLVGLGGNDFLVGGLGNDNMQGGTGNDIYYVDSAGDQIFENVNEGDDLAVCFASFSLGAGQGVETLSANEGSGAINLTGNALGQSIYGNSSANVLTTGGGSDYMVGGAGNDVFVLTNAPGVATIADYAAGDVVDVTQYLSVANGTNVTAGGYVRITATGELQIDANGGGDGFATIANVAGNGNVTLRYLSGGTATDVSIARSASQTAMVAAVAAVGMADLVPAEKGHDESVDSGHPAASVINDSPHWQALAPAALDDAHAPLASAFAPPACGIPLGHAIAASAYHGRAYRELALEHRSAKLPGSLAMPSIWSAWRPAQTADHRLPLWMTTSKAVTQIGELPKPFVERFTEHKRETAPWGPVSRCLPRDAGRPMPGAYSVLIRISTRRLTGS